jgi:hypothetical protein
VIYAVFSYCYELYLRFTKRLKFTFHFDNYEFSFHTKYVFWRITPINSLSYLRKNLYIFKYEDPLKTEQKFKVANTFKLSYFVLQSNLQWHDGIFARPVLSDLFPLLRGSFRAAIIAFTNSVDGK